MGQYIARRLLFIVPILIGVSLVIFGIMRIIPGDIALMVLAGGGEGSITPEKLATTRKQLGLDKPLYVQYVEWTTGLLRLELGKSYWTGRPILHDLKERFPVSIELAFLALCFSIIIGIIIGILSALFQDTWVDYLLRVVSIAGLSIPNFWLGTLIILFMVLWFNWMPPLGYVYLWEDPLKNLQQVVWPALAIGFAMVAITSRMTRSQMLEVLREDYIRTARAKGLQEKVVVTRHALRNALLPVVTICGSQFGHMLGGTVIAETIFSMPGMGLMLVTSVQQRDYPIVQDIVMIMAIIFAFLNLGVDLLYGVLDPRIRYE